MDYQVQHSFGDERQYEEIITDREEMYIPRESDNEYVFKQRDEDKTKKDVDYDLPKKHMYAQLIRVFKDINTGQLYIETNTLLKLRGTSKYDDKLSKYSLGLVPITSELLAKLIKDYERRYEVHVDIEVLPIDLVNNLTYDNIDDFINKNKDYKSDFKKNEIRDLFFDDNNKDKLDMNENINKK